MKQLKRGWLGRCSDRASPSCDAGGHANSCAVMRTPPLECAMCLSTNLSVELPRLVWAVASMVLVRMLTWQPSIGLHAGMQQVLWEPSCMLITNEKDFNAAAAILMLSLLS